jgi:hypothetical protein
MSNVEVKSEEISNIEQGMSNIEGEVRGNIEFAIGEPSVSNKECRTSKGRISGQPRGVAPTRIFLRFCQQTFKPFVDIRKFLTYDTNVNIRDQKDGISYGK